MLKIEVFADIANSLKTMNGFYKQMADGAAKSSKKTALSFDNIFKSVVALNQGLELAGKLFGAVAGAMNKAIDAAILQEEVVNDLNNALVAAGKYSKVASNDLQKYASELQSVTTFGDEAILSAMSLGVALADLSGQQLKNATLAAANLSARMGIDLSTAMEIISKSAVTGGQNLRRYGIVVQKGATSAESLSNAIEKINKQFAGAAESKLKTFSGSLQSLNNAWGDQLEILGDAIVKNPIIIDAILLLKKGISELTPVFESIKIAIIDFTKTFVEGLIVALDYINYFLESIWPAVTGVIDFFEAIAQPIVDVGKTITAVVVGIIDALFDGEPAFNIWDGFRRTIDVIAGGLKTGIAGGLALVLKGYLAIANVLGIKVPATAQESQAALEGLAKEGIAQVNDGLDVNKKTVERTNKEYIKIDQTIKKVQKTLLGLGKDAKASEASRGLASQEASEQSITWYKKVIDTVKQLGEVTLNAFAGAANSLSTLNQSAFDAINSLMGDSALNDQKLTIDYQAEIEKIKVGDALNFEGIDKKLSDTAAAIAQNKAKAIAKVYADLNSKLTMATTLAEKDRLEKEAAKTIDKINREADQALASAQIEAANEKTKIESESQIALQKADIEHQSELQKAALDADKKRQDILDKAEADRQKLFKDTAMNILKTAGAALADAFLPGAGKFVGPLLDILNAGGDAAAKLIEKTLEQIPIIIEKLIDAAPQIIESLIKNIPKMSVAVANALIKASHDPKFIASIAEAFIKGAAQGVVEAFKGIGKALENIVKGIFNVGKWLVDGILDAFAAAGNFLARIFKFDGGGKGTVENFLGFDFPWIAFAKGGMVGGSAKVAGDSKVNDIIPALLSPGEVVIPRSILSAGPGSVIEFLQSLGVGVPGFFLGGGGKKKGFFGSIVNAVTDVAGSVYDTGKNIVGGAVDAIVGIADVVIPGNISAVYEALKKFAQNISWVEFVKNPVKEAGNAVRGAIGVFQPYFRQMLSLSEGGQVFGGVPGRDSIPARLTPGELVVDRSTTEKLQSFLDDDGEKVTHALLGQIVQLLKKDTEVSTTIQIDKNILADTILRLSRNNQRLAV